MSDNRFKFGVALSILWIAIMIGLFVFRTAQFLAMTPNEWGDFFAGTFAPLAFFWLVLGYLQQGDELKLSTQALRLQAEELKKSVEQQQALVEVSRQQVESEKEALIYERTRREEAAKPNIDVASAGGTFRGDGYASYNVVFTNTGNIALGFIGTLNVAGSLILLADLPFFNQGAQHQSVFTSPTPLQGNDSILSISYRDSLGRKFTKKYGVWRERDHSHSDLVFSMLELGRAQ